MEGKKGSRQSLVELEEATLDEEIDSFPIGLGCALDMFREKEEVFEIIHSLPQKYSTELSMEIIYDKFRTIVDRYQDQPHLLDRHLEPMIELLLVHFRTCFKPEELPLKHLSLKFLRQLFKVRGPKEVVKRMPHEIADLVPVLTYLEDENLDDPNTWESGYVLVMWLSILVINPFHLKLLDGEKKSGGITIADRLMKVCKKCLALNNNIGQAAPFLIARFLTRPDMQEVYLDSFIDWACKNLSQNSSFGTRVGAFAALSSIFKQAKRQELLKYGEKVLAALLNSKFEKCDTILRKSGTKLIQRIGMMFMKTKNAPWRYQRGSRNLLNNLKGKTTLSTSAGDSLAGENGNPEDEDYSELNQYSSAIESVLDKLLEGLTDKDTIVRWSAAKGIGRVTTRLPKDYADEVVEGILSKFSPREGNSVWHGGCLALAELGRRGLLLPERLPRVIVVIKKALIYDEIRGNFSVGAHVRDAACYVMWAFARAFEPDIIQPFVNDIATALIITLSYDREVNCRRAASAAFQENVGRQGNFPHGIDIVTIADYFAIGVRSNAFTKISVEIAQYKEYTCSLIDHLLELKFNHFDGSIRSLTAQTFANLTPLDVNHTISKVIPKLIPMSMESDTYTSHGALLSLGSVLRKLREINRLELSLETLNSIREIVPAVMKRRFSGSHKGNELLRQGLNFFINCCCLAKMPYHGEEEFLEKSFGCLEDNVANVDTITRETAAEGLSNFLREYFYKNPIREKRIGEFIRIFCKNLGSHIMTTRQGYANAVGKLPLEIVREDFVTVLNSLIGCCKSTTETAVWAESRRDAINALGNIFSNHKIVQESDWKSGIPINQLDIKELYECLLAGMNDYTTDKRGDIGSWVREASMTTLKTLTIRIHECGSGIVDEETIAKMMGLIAKQCVEKIDNVRVLAGKIFAELLHNNSPTIDSIPKKKEIMKVFPQDFTNTVNWRSTSATFPKFVELLPLQEYTYYLLEGFVISGGSLSDSVMKDANGAITNYFLASGAMGDAELHRIGNLLLDIFEANHKVDRVTFPIMKFLFQLLQSGTLLPLLAPGSDEWGLKLIEVTKTEMLKTGRVDKIVSAIELFCETLQGSPAVAKSALKKLVVYQCHAFPRVRLACSQKMYESLLTYGTDGLADPEALEAVMTLLSETQWDSKVESIRSIRNQICDLLNIPQPSILKPA